LEPKNLETILDQHQRVSEAIRQRDATGAYDAMRRHITFLINYVCDESRMLKQNDAIVQNHTQKAQEPAAQTAS
jgi:DNA-binding FadR family transcriptional regulator